MDILANILNRNRDDVDVYTQAFMRNKLRIAEEQSKFLSDPTLVERTVSHLAHSSLPEKVAAKTALGSPLAKIEQGIPENDIRRGLATKLLQDAPRVIAANPGMHPAEAIAREYGGRMAQLNQGDALYKNIREQNSALWGKQIATAPGYEEWKAAQKKPEWEMTSPATSFLFGAGLSGLGMLAGAAAGSLLPGPGTAAGATAGRLAGGAVSGTILRWLAGKAAPTIASGVARAAGAGALAIPSFAAFDVPANVIRQSDWAQDRPWKTLGAEMLLGGAAAHVADKAVMRLGTKVGERMFKGMTNPLEGAAEESGSRQFVQDAEGKFVRGYRNADGSIVTAPKDTFGPQGNLIPKTDAAEWEKEILASRASAAAKQGEKDAAYDLAREKESVAEDYINKISGWKAAKTEPDILKESLTFERNVKDFDGVKIADRVADKKVELADAANETAAVRMARLSALTEDDITKIRVEGADPKEVAKARLKANMEQELVDKQAATLQKQTDILEITAKLKAANKDLSHEDALIKAESIIDPSAEHQVMNDITLEKAGWIKDDIDKLSPRERAEWAEKVRQFGRNEEKFAGTSKYDSEQDIYRSIKPFVPTTEDAGITRLMPVKPYADKFKSDVKTKKVKETAPAEITPVELDVLREAVKVTPSKTVVAKVVKEVTPVDKVLKVAPRASFDERLSSFSNKIKSSFDELSKATGVKDIRDRVAKFAAESDIELQALKSAHPAMVTSGKFVQLEKERTQKIADLLSKHEDTIVKTNESDTAKMLEGMADTDTPAGYKVQELNNETMEQLKGERKRRFLDMLDAEDVDIKGKTPEQIVNDPEVQRVWKSISGKFVAAAGIGAGLVPLSAMMGGDTNTAEAGMIKDAIKVPAMLVDIAKSSRKTTEQVITDMAKSGIEPPRISENGRSLQNIMRSMNFAPKDANIFTKTKVMALDKILSPGHRDYLHFDARNADGSVAAYAPGTGINMTSQVIAANTDASLKVVNNIMSNAGIRPELDAIAAHFDPLIKKYNKQNLEFTYSKAKASMLDQVLNGTLTGKESDLKLFSDKMKRLKGDFSKLTDPDDIATYEAIVAKKNEALATADKLKPVIEQFAKEHEMYAKSAAEKWATARVAFAVDGTGMKEGNSWLRGLLQNNEKIAADEIADLNKAYAVRMKESGHQIIKENYIHHAKHPSINWKEDKAHLESFSGEDGDEAMRLVNFFSRTSGSKLMIPDVHYIMGKYLPDANKRLGISDFWKMGQEGGWDNIRQQMKRRGGYEGALNYLDDLRKTFDPVDVGGSAKWLNRYAAFEVARLLTLSPSVSMKHALKLMGNWTVFPSSEMPQATAYGANLAFRQGAQEMLGQAWKGKDIEADLARALTSMHHTYSAVSDIAPFELPVSMYDKIITNVNKAGSVLVNMTERLDRGITFAASMQMASRKGMTPQQSLFALMDSVARVNFLTGPSNPEWLKNPLIRTMMMFQGTPFKILEQRAMLAYQGGKDVVNTLKLLKTLREDVKKGETEFKWQMLKDELTRSKDVYGTPYSKQLLKQALVMGTVLTTGKMVLDSELFGHVVHIPGLKLGESGVELGLNPLVAAGYQTATGKNQKEDEDEFWLSRFFQSWLGQSGFPAIAHKMVRLRDDDIPAIYRDNKLNYLFGVPKAKEE